MSISLIDNFIINVKNPIDSRTLVANIAERNAIPSQYRYDSMAVFQKDVRKTYIWNDIASSWSEAGAGSILDGLGLTNAIAYWNTDSTIDNSFIYINQKNSTSNTGYLGINENNPKAEIHINSALGSALPLYISNLNVASISTNWLNGNVIDDLTRASNNISYDNGVFRFLNRAPGAISTTLTEMLTIDFDSISLNGILRVSQPINLGSASNSKNLLSTLRNTGGVSNVVNINEYAIRNSSGNDWNTWGYHNSISVDGVFNSPGTDTLTFWERQPYLKTQYFGSENKKTLTINSSTNPHVKVDGKLMVTNITQSANNSGRTLVVDAATNEVKYVTASTVPLGGIIMWSGTTEPTGWALCNGQTKNAMLTPNLVGQFVLGSLFSDVNQTGGAFTGFVGEHALSIGEMPIHGHLINAVYNENIDNGTKVASGGGAIESVGSQFTSTSGSGQTHRHTTTLPPHYKLAYIMYVGV